MSRTCSKVRHGSGSEGSKPGLSRLIWTPLVTDCCDLRKSSPGGSCSNRLKRAPSPNNHPLLAARYIGSQCSRYKRNLASVTHTVVHCATWSVSRLWLPCSLDLCHHLHGPHAQAVNHSVRLRRYARPLTPEAFPHISRMPSICVGATLTWPYQQPRDPKAQPKHDNPGFWTCSSYPPLFACSSLSTTVIGRLPCPIVSRSRFEHSDRHTQRSSSPAPAPMRNRRASCRVPQGRHSPSLAASLFREGRG